MHAHQRTTLHPPDGIGGQNTTKVCGILLEGYNIISKAALRGPKMKGEGSHLRTMSLNQCFMEGRDNAFV